MKITKFILLILLFFHPIVINAQKVSNVTFRQEKSTIIISYNLETKISCKISLFVSTDDGKTWQGPLKKVTGDTVAKIGSGNHSIIWNVLEEFEELRGDKIKFQVRADSGDLETVKIGTQEWSVKNLDVSNYRNGDIIPEVKDPKEWSTLKTGAWCYYDNDSENGKIYGKLYNWYAVNDPRGLAPEGFHIPSENDWKILFIYLGGNDIAGGKMKEQGTEHWNTPNASSTNSSGFTALPGGSFFNTGIFYDIGYSCCWWSSSKVNATNSCYIHTSYNNRSIYSGIGNKRNGFYVRCLID